MAKNNAKKDSLCDDGVCFGCDGLRLLLNTKDILKMFGGKRKVEINICQFFWFPKKSGTFVEVYCQTKNNEYETSINYVGSNITIVFLC